MNQEEDEWYEIVQRFKIEGIDFNSLKSDDRIVHIYRWLVDAEINLKNSRRICEKLREQQNEELEEMESYMGKVRELSEKRAIDIENETTKLQEQLEAISSIIAELFLQGDSLVEKISNLVTDYIHLNKEVQVLNKLKLSHSHSDDLISEMISISTEKESLKREVVEMNERMQFLQKSSRELELDNEKLTFKLSEVFAELEEKEIRLGEYTTLYSGESSNALNPLISKPSDSNKSTLSHVDLDQRSVKQDKKDLSREYSVESTSPSLTMNDLADCQSTSRLSSLMSSCHEVARLEENKRLQSECESLKTRIAALGERYNNLALKYIQIKAKKKFQIEELRGRLDASLCQIETLQVQLSVQRQRLRAEEIFRKQIESDLRKLQDEKRSILVRLQNSEMEQKESHREIAILQKRTGMLDAANSDLLAQLLKLKYKESPKPEKSLDELPEESS